VSLAVYGLARWQPFAPEVPPAAAVAGGDAAAGQAVFARSCAACHGAEAEGGVGPRLADSGLAAETVAGVVAAGRGIMPAGIVTGTEAADVAAYVAQIAGGAAVTTSPSVVPAPSAPAGGLARLTGARLGGLAVDLKAPAPADWTVWLDGPAGRLTVGEIRAGANGIIETSVDGGLALLGRYGTVLVGTDPDDPALAGSLTPARSRELGLLLIDDPARPGDASLLDAAAAQIDVLHEHVGFLAAARDEGNLANVRFHGEHMVNITRGEPLQDVDGNGDVSNPGDGVGLIDGPDAYLRHVGALIGPALTDEDREAAALAAVIAREGARCGGAATVAEAAPSIAAIERADARLAVAWTGLRSAARRSAVVVLETR